MALRVVIPKCSVRKVGEPQEYTSKRGTDVRKTDVNVEDATGEPLVVSFDHTEVPLPDRLDVIDVEADLTTYVPPGGFRATINLVAVTWWAHSEAVAEVSGS